MLKPEELRTLSEENGRKRAEESDILKDLRQRMADAAKEGYYGIKHSFSTQDRALCGAIARLLIAEGFRVELRALSCTMKFDISW